MTPARYRTGAAPNCDLGQETPKHRTVRSHSLLIGRRPRCAGNNTARTARTFLRPRSIILVGNLILNYRNRNAHRRAKPRNSRNNNKLPHVIRFGLPVLLLIAYLAGCSTCSSPAGCASPDTNVDSENLSPDRNYWRDDHPAPSLVHSRPQSGYRNDLHYSTFEPTPFSSLIQHSFAEEGGDFEPDISADGKWLVFTSLRHALNPDLYLKQTNGATATRLTSDPAAEVEPAFSPQSDKVAYATNRANNYDIWVVGVDGTNPTRLTSATADEFHPSWSPDGKQIVYCAFGTRSRQWELWVVSVENPSVKKFIGYGRYPRWCPNPEVPKIAFQLNRYRGSHWYSIWTVDYIDGEARFPTEIITSMQHACIRPAWNPDGSKLSYCTVTMPAASETQSPNDPYTPTAVATDRTARDVWIVDLDGRNNHRLTSSDGADEAPTWSPDGRVFFCSDREGIENIWSVRPRQVNFAAEEPVDLTQHPQSGILAN